MFEWNDEELTDIIWSETGGNDDHTVPYPDGREGKAPGYGDNIKKERNVQDANIKSTDQKKPTTKTDLSNDKLDGSSRNDSGGATSGYSVELSANSLANATKTNQDSLGDKASNNPSESSRHECLRDERNRLDDDSRIFHQQNEDLEQGDFIDYGWANIGSFDDLDTIFSNSDSIFGDSSLPSTHELWPSGQDVTSSPDKSIPLSIDSPRLGLGSPRSPSERLEVKAECRLDQETSSTGDEENVDDITSNVYVCTDARDHGGGKNMLLPKEKGNNQKRVLKGCRKLEQEGKLTQMQELCGSLSPHLNKFGVPYVTDQPDLASELSQQRHFQGPEHVQHKHFPGPPVASSIYGDMRTHYSPMPVWSQFHSGQSSHSCIRSSYKASPGNSNPFSKSLNASSKPLMMTPQEKIEKLRKRQQLRAMLAIQKQQQQLSHQIFATEQSAREGGSMEENLGSIPSLNPSSPLEQGDSSSVCLAVEGSSVEEVTLYLLQDVISKLDPQIRVCIRDSLFRLAQSATQRQCGNDGCGTNEDGIEASEEEISTINRFIGPPNVETETNPIDRIVAHLLFHNPSELTSKLAEIPKTSMFTMLNSGGKAIGSPSFSRASQQTSETNPPRAHQGPKTCSSYNAVEKMGSSLCIKPENASNNEGADDSVIGVDSTS